MLESLMPNHLEPQNMELIRMKAAHLMFFFIATNIPPVLDYKSVCFREHRTDVLSSCFLWEPSPSQEDSASTANKSSPLWSGLSPGSRHWIVVAKPTVSASAQWAQASPPPRLQLLSRCTCPQLAFVNMTASVCHQAMSLYLWMTTKSNSSNQS